VDLTDGEPTPHGDPETRKKESVKSSRILGIVKRESLLISQSVSSGRNRNPPGIS